MEAPNGLCGESQPRFIFAQCIFIVTSIMHSSDCQLRRDSQKSSLLVRRIYECNETELCLITDEIVRFFSARIENRAYMKELCCASRTSVCTNRAEMSFTFEEIARLEFTTNNRRDLSSRAHEPTRIDVKEKKEEHPEAVHCQR